MTALSKTKFIVILRHLSSGYNDENTSLRVKLSGMQWLVILCREILVLNTIFIPFHYIKTTRTDYKNVNWSMAA